MRPYVLVPLILVPVLLLGCQGQVGPDGIFDFTNPTPGGSTPQLPVAEPAPLPEPTVEVAPAEHPYFPMTPGMHWTYEGQSEGVSRRDEVRVLQESRVILEVECAQFHQRVFLDGELVELTTEWFARDAEGNVWKFGEESTFFEGGLFVSTADSWVAGVDGAQPWLFLAADPQVGDVYLGNVPDGLDRLQVLSVTESTIVPAGTYADCLQILENGEDPDDSDLIIFAPGVGLASEQSGAGKIDLVSVGRD